MITESTENKLMWYGVPAKLINRIVSSEHQQTERMEAMQTKLEDIHAMKDKRFADSLQRFRHVLTKTGVSPIRYHMAMDMFISGAKLYDVCTEYKLKQSLFMRFLQLDPRYIEMGHFYVSPDGAKHERQGHEPKRTDVDKRLHIKHIGIER